jgi:hypothetical protein
VRTCLLIPTCFSSWWTFSVECLST